MNHQTGTGALDGSGEHFDETADVVVVGYGGAGVAAALAAREEGASVLAIDRYAGGGATALSGGIVYAGAGTSVQRAAGLADTVDGMYDYLSSEVGDAVSPQTLRRFCEQSPAMIDWLEAQGVPFDSALCPFKTSYPNNDYYLYFSGSEASGAGRAVTTPVQRGHRVKGKGTSGKKLFAPMARSARERGVRLLPYTRAERLITDASGRMCGVEAMTMREAPARVQQRYRRLAAVSAKPGIYAPDLRRVLQRRLDQIERRYARCVRIAARSVILTAGGFIANTAMVGEHAPHCRDGLALGTAADDGSGIVMGTALGAATAKLDHVSVWRFIAPPSPLLGGIAVGSDGNRLTDESRYGAALGGEIIRRPDRRAWVLIDSTIEREVRRRLWPETLWFQRMQAGAILQRRLTAETLEAVAAKAGIDARQLRETVEAHNAAIADGAPDPMGKPADFTRPLVTPPFSLLDFSVAPSTVNPTPMLTLGGLVVDEDSGAVQTSEGAAVDGLYAAGRTAVGICSNSYVSGLSIADCIFSGRRAGAHAARESRAVASAVAEPEGT